MLGWAGLVGEQLQLKKESRQAWSWSWIEAESLKAGFVPRTRAYVCVCVSAPPSSALSLSSIGHLSITKTVHQCTTESFSSTFARGSRPSKGRPSNPRTRFANPPHVKFQYPTHHPPPGRSAGRSVAFVPKANEAQLGIAFRGSTAQHAKHEHEHQHGPIFLLHGCSNILGN